MTTSTDKLQQMREIRDRSGVRAVLIYLNGLTDHRFTALYRFDADTLKNLYFFDREQPDVESCSDIPVMASYCVFVRSSGQTFMTLDSLEDERVRDHPKRFEVRSYCGVPLVDEDGRMFGTICHFDFQPIPIREEDVALMEAIAPLLRASLTSRDQESFA